jgi:hypothetical protein
VCARESGIQDLGHVTELGRPDGAIPGVAGAAPHQPPPFMPPDTLVAAK